MNRGVPSERITLAIPPKELEEKEEFKSNEDKLLFQNEQIKHPEAFSDPIIEEKITKIIEDKFKITVLRDHILHPPNTKDDSLQDCFIKDANGCLEKVVLKNMDPALSDDEDEEEDLSYNKRSYDKNSF